MPVVWSTSSTTRKSRENGRDHNDWPIRKYHKKCWYKMITLEEEEDEESADK